MFENVIKDCMQGLIVEHQNKVCSKVCGRENYVIHMKHGDVIYYGTKKGYLNRGLNRMLLSDLKYTNTFKFTYKKDFVNALQSLGVNI